MFGMIGIRKSFQGVYWMGSFSYHVGQRIKKYRKSRGYTIEQFSSMINKSKATLSKYENGTITIDIETLYEIAKALDIDMKCFIDYQPPVFHTEGGSRWTGTSTTWCGQARLSSAPACASWCAHCCASPPPRPARRST